MIVDIDFRWVKKDEVRAKGPVFGDIFPMEKVVVQALQYRKKVEIEPEWVDTENGLMLCSHAWTDWQDVPVVEE